MSDRTMKKNQVSLSEYYWIIVDKDYTSVALDCPICKILLADKQDVLSYKQNNCTDVFVYPNKEKWDTGWRPDESEISNQREKRQSVPTYIL